MSTSTPVRSLFISTLCLCLLPIDSAHAQMKQADPDAMDVARTPLEDFNIDSKDIPDVLLAASQDPYDSNGIRNCNDVVARIAVLDNVLGPDFDIPQDEGGGISTGRVAKSVVGSLIPFRGIVREVSGANQKRNEARLAFMAGMVRRAYLKGKGEAQGCAYPARPRQIAETIDSGASTNVPPNIPRGESKALNEDLVPLERESAKQ